MIKAKTALLSDQNHLRDTRDRILSAAIDLLNRGGRNSVTTRAVADAAGVQAPAIYRLFQDMGGLLDAVAEHGFTSYLKEKMHRDPVKDPVENLRTGWSLHVNFGLSNPAIYKLMYCDPHPGAKSPAAANSYRILREHIRRIAMTGQLRVAEERAADLVHASACGMVLTLLSVPEKSRDLQMAEIAREAVIASITTLKPAPENPSPAAAAIALQAILPEALTLSVGERTLLEEWLERLARERR